MVGVPDVWRWQETQTCLLDILLDCSDTYARKRLTNCLISYGEGRRGKSRRAQGTFVRMTECSPLRSPSLYASGPSIADAGVCGRARSADTRPWWQDRV